MISVVGDDEEKMRENLSACMGSLVTWDNDCFKESRWVELTIAKAVEAMADFGRKFPGGTPRLVFTYSEI